jgi:hypothetical protein
MQERRLAGTVRADNRYFFSSRNTYIYIAQSGIPSEIRKIYSLQLKNQIIHEAIRSVSGIIKEKQ